MRHSSLLAGVLLPLLQVGCMNAYVAREHIDKPLLMTHGDVEQPYQVVGHVGVEQTGWYLLSFIPLAAIDLQELLTGEFARAVNRLDADAVLFLEVDVVEPTFADLLKFPFIGCTARAEATGMAVRWVDGDGGGGVQLGEAQALRRDARVAEIHATERPTTTTATAPEVGSSR